MDIKNHKNSLDSKILALTKKILDSSIGIIEGCRKMIPLLQERGVAYEKDFLIFTGVESETDTLPIGVTRQYWNKEKLEVKDREIKMMEQYYEKDIFEACRKLLRFLQ